MKTALGKIGFALFAAACMAGPLQAQEYPSKPVNILLGYSPGGSGDTIARFVAEELSKALGQPFVVQNRPGAAGIIAAEAVARSAPDGYTLLSGSSTELSANVSVYKQLPYDPRKDFEPIIQYSIQPNVLMIKAKDARLPISSVRELVDYAKANPGKVSYGSAGNGSTQHLAMEALSMRAGVELLHVPYKGGANAIADLLGGQIDVNFSPLPEIIGHIKSGRLKALAVSSSQRSALLPDVPTMNEAGVAGYEFVGWHGLVAPAGTPKAVVDKLNAAIQKALQNDLGRRLTEAGLTVTGGTPEQARQRLNDSIKLYGELVKASGMPLM
ncbi:tripartite tricarboxylate transporter substrate binding protein [Pigmentiphaga soli]|uniref:Tripartite tricarboxylate transporter substrate binding protein n=1 Tax=Pigmentiphaga soli TaxID=1007095 RepID=A0ABP8HNS8_9BURK